MNSEITPVHNFIFFQVEKEREDELDTRIGTLVLATQFEPKKHARIYGEVIGVPQKLTNNVVLWRDDPGLPRPVTYYSGEMAADTAKILKADKFMEPHEEKEEDIKLRRQLYDPSDYMPTYKTLAHIEPEVLPGDRIYFHFNTLSEENRIRTSDGRKIYKVRYDQVFCAVRNGQIIPIGSWVMVEPMWDEGVQEIEVSGHEKVRGKLSASGLITELHDKPKPLHGILRHIGSPLKGDPVLDVHPGDKVYFLPLSEFKNTIEGNQYYVMRQNDLIAQIL